MEPVSIADHCDEMFDVLYLFIQMDFSEVLDEVFLLTCILILFTKDFSCY